MKLRGEADERQFMMTRMMIVMSLRAIVASLIVIVITASGFAAANPATLPGKDGGQHPAGPETAAADPLGRTTPQGTVLGFMKSASQKDYDQALRYLHTKKTGIAAQQLVMALQTMLDRGFSGSIAMLSNKPEGQPDENLPSSQYRVGKVETPSGNLEILLERVQPAKGPTLWLFSAETLKQLPGYYSELDIRTIDSYLPKFLAATWFLWFPLWQWLSIILVIPVSFGLATLLVRLFTPLFLLLTRRTTGLHGDRYVKGLSGPLRVMVFALAVWCISIFSRSVLTSVFWAYVASTLTVIGTTWLCVRVVTILFSLKQARLASASSSKLSVVQLLRKLTNIVVVIIGALLIMYIANINLTAVLTGLGVGGIAVAFAAQKTLENLFGGIMIASDQPIGIGDFCRAGEYTGTVEDVGLRSTRIRTLARTLVSVPNGQLAVMSLENFSARDKIWFHHTVQLRYETAPDQLRYILAEIQRMLSGHEKVEQSSLRVSLFGFGESSLDIEVFAYVLEKEYRLFLHVQQDLLLRIMDIVEASGSGFAFPSRTTYVAQDSGLDDAKRQQAIAAVRQWREQGNLPFAGF
jgi:MscS family membrane protein